MMPVVERNLIRLVKCGAFDQREPLEPMSNWKWRRLLQWADSLDVAVWVRDGLRACSDDFFLQIPTEVRDAWEATVTDSSSAYGEEDIERLTNPLLNYRLRRLLAEEDTPTLQLLLTILRFARITLERGISLKHIVYLGIYLRMTKDDIDYDLLQAWIRELNMQRMARLEGELLVWIFGFEASEIRFAHIKEGRDMSQVARTIFTPQTADAPVMLHARASARYMRYYPTEGMTSVVAGFVRSLAQVEE